MGELALNLCKTICQKSESIQCSWVLLMFAVVLLPQITRVVWKGREVKSSPFPTLRQENPLCLSEPATALLHTPITWPSSYAIQLAHG
jgi:hypothetical protein